MMGSQLKANNINTNMDVFGLFGVRSSKQTHKKQSRYETQMRDPEREVKQINRLQQRVQSKL